MDYWRAAVGRQFHAALDMLGNAMEACPEGGWNEPGKHRFWYLAFHTLFWTDLYLSGEDEPGFRPPSPFGLTELEEGVLPERAFSKDELRGYLGHCRGRLDAVLNAMSEAWVEAPCPVAFRAMSNGELLLYNMRHAQHHAAQLNLLLRQRTDSAPGWVSKGGQRIRTEDIAPLITMEP